MDPTIYQVFKKIKDNISPFLKNLGETGKDFP